MELIDQVFFTSLVVLFICHLIEKSDVLEEKSIADYVNALIGIGSLVMAFVLLLIRIWQ